MGEDRGPWQESHRAWERLAGWRRNRASETPETLDEGEQALNALTDIGLVRRMLDQTEFEAVRAGRQQGKSWAEIAIRLGVTRQSAWERWRDVDEPEATQPAQHESQRDVTDTVAKESARQTKLAWRRRSTVVVPNVIGMLWEDASKALQEEQLVAVGTDPDAPPQTQSWPYDVITDQSPESGARVPPGSAVTLWIERGGGSGVREPRRPKPDPKTGRKMLDPLTDDAVS